MEALARFVIARRWWVVGAWLLLAVAGGIGAPHATGALSYDFGLPGQPGYETNERIVQQFGSGGANAPVLLVVGDGSAEVGTDAARAVATAAAQASPGARVTSWVETPDLLAGDGRTGVVLVYPTPLPGAEAYAAALPALEGVATQASRQLGVPVVATGTDALAEDGGGGGADVLAETLFGGIGALVVLVLVFGSFLAVTPLLVAAGSILTTFLIVWGLTEVTDVSFIVQYLLALIGLGVAIDYALLVVTRWREERGRAPDNAEAVVAAMRTAGRSVLFSGVTVAVSLAALVALPVPFLRSVGFTGLLIPIVSVLAALTLLPALLVIAGPRLAWPNRRSSDPESRAWRRIGRTIVRHRWIATAASAVVLLALASPVLGLRLGSPTNDSLASIGGPAGTAVGAVERAGLGAGLTAPIEIVADDPSTVVGAVSSIVGVAGTAAPAAWTAGGRSVVDVWTADDVSSDSGSAVAAQVRDTAEGLGAQVGGIPAQDSDFIDAVYGNAWWVIAIIVVVTFLLLAVALRSVVLPVKALVLNVISIGAAYGMTILIWQHGFLTELLFGQRAAGSITTWIPIAVFAFLFGLSMDYEVFLLSRIREEYDRPVGLGGHDTDDATVHGVARTGRLVTSAALILFLAFISLSRVPATDVKILATGLALGILLDATIVRGVLAPALVAALGPANWWVPRWWARRIAARPSAGAHEA